MNTHDNAFTRALQDYADCRPTKSKWKQELATISKYYDDAMNGRFSDNLYDELNKLANEVQD